jgi:hypothetical protein
LLTVTNEFFKMTHPIAAQLVGNEVNDDVEALWAAVFRCSAIVIQHATKFGFTGMHKADPSIADLLLYIRLVEGAIDGLIETPDTVTFEEMRLLLNAQKQFATLKMVAKILQSKEGTHEQFAAAMRDLEGQASF